MGSKKTKIAMKIAADRPANFLNKDEMYREIFEKTRDGIVLMEAKTGRIIDCNPAFEKIVGRRLRDLSKSCIWDICLFGEREKGRAKFFEIMEQGEGRSSEFFIERPDGSAIEIDFTAGMIEINGKKYQQAIIRDISGAKCIDRGKTEFLSMVSHQLRTPLANVGLTIEMLLRGMAGKFNKEQREYLRDIDDSVKQMTKLIEMFLNISRIEMGTWPVKVEEKNPANFIDAILEHFDLRLEKSRIKLIKSYDKSLPRKIRIDPNIARNVLENLISNAIKYTPTGGRISIKAKKKDGGLLVRVSDTGPGISRKIQPFIFTKICKTHPVAGPKAKGAGLGLYIAKSLMDLVGGKIWFKSSRAEGTTFYVLFPGM